MSIFGGRKEAKRRAENNAKWNSFNQNMSSWKSSLTSENSRKVSDNIESKRREYGEKNVKKSQNKQTKTISENHNLTTKNADFSFRRNATLSTMQNERRQKTERQHEKDLREYRRKIGILLSIICGISVTFLIILSQFSGSFKIDSEVSLSADETKKYSNLVDQYFAKNPFERFSFGRREKELTQFIVQQAPEVKEVKLNTSGLGGGRLEIVFREPVAMWSSGGSTNFVDSAGVVFEKNYFNAPPVSISDESGLAPANNGQTASSSFLSFVGQLSSNINLGGLKMQRVVIPYGAIRYVNVYLEGREYPFLSQIDRDPGGQAADIVAIAKYMDQKKISPQYIDVRVTGRAYWK